MIPTPRGILNPRRGEKLFREALRLPSPDLAEWVRHYWSVRWDLRGRESQVQRVLSHPSVHLVAERGDGLERGRSRIVGVTTGTFAAVLQGEGFVFGISFRSGGFRPFHDASVSTLTNRTVAISSVFGSQGEALVERLLALETDADLVKAAEAFLRARLPEPDPWLHTVNQIVDRIRSDREVTRVEQVARLCGIGTRQLQRLFSEYVGVSPKWVIQRYRLHEAAERLAGSDVGLEDLAQELGYFDQAHFVRDFKAIVGCPPGEYARIERSG